MIVYVWGNLTSDNFTPRPGKDTIAKPGQKPGLSSTAKISSGRKAQGIDLDRLGPPLKSFPDDPSEGGAPGHIAIAPVNDAGEVDKELLQEWASYRKSGQTHPLTQLLLDAVTEPNRIGGKQ